MGSGVRSSLSGLGPIRKGHEFSVDALSAYLKAHAPAIFPTASSTISSILQFEAGQSNPTFLLSLNDGLTRYILRKKPPGELLPSAHAVEREFRIMQSLGLTHVPVPQVFHLCVDASVIGTPFYIMEALEGRVFVDPSLPGVSPSERRAIYTAMVDTLAQIHRIDWRQMKLSDFGRQEQFYTRQVARWSQQYLKSVPAGSEPCEPMRKLVAWLPSHIPHSSGEEEECCVVHGDFRLENVIFHKTQPRIIAVLDWELSTLGHPLSDLAYMSMLYHCTPNFAAFTGLTGSAIDGIPSERRLVTRYCRFTRRDSIIGWNFYLAFSFFRGAGIAFGVRARARLGNASSTRAEQVGACAEELATIGWNIASTPRNIHLSLDSESDDAADSSSSSSSSSPSSSSSSSPASWPLLSGSKRGREYYQRVKQFMDEHVYPNEELFFAQLNAGPTRWHVPPIMDELKAKAKAAGLWNLFLPDSEFGAGLSNLEYAPCCELMGRSFIGPEVFNCNAPDTGNMEVLVRYGTPAQQQEWLVPLLEGRIRSCFAMTEPAVASSDATNICTQITRAGDHYLINGVKWWTSGAGDPRCKVAILMGRSSGKDESLPVHRQQSMILVPMDAPGVTVVRPLTVFGYDDAPHGHCEVRFENVKVPLTNMLLGEGRGFEIAQGRLGPGRIHHAMRTIGMAERALEALMDRAVKRVAFGKKLAEHASIVTDVAWSRCELDQARLLTMKAAHMMDTVGNKEARSEIAMIKVVAPHMALKIIDRAIQAHGAAGVSGDFFLAYAYAAIRTLRIADGPDEVHLRTIGQLEFKKRFSRARL